MRILFLDQFSEPGGAQHCLLQLLPAVRSVGWEAHVALPGEGPLFELSARWAASVHRLPLRGYALGRKGPKDTIGFLLDLSKVAEEIRLLLGCLEPDLLYVNGPRLMPAVARANPSCRVLFHSHNVLPVSRGRWLVARAIDSCGANVIAASRRVAGQWQRTARVIYGGVVGPPADWQRRVRGGGPRVGLIGRFAAEKGQAEFVAAAESLRTEWPDAEFVLCGDALFGDHRAELYRRRLLVGAPSNVRHLSWQQNVYEVLETLDLLIHPSFEEGGIPNVILQAFAAGVPVLATAVGGIPEVITEGVNGFLLASPSSRDIVWRLRDLIPKRALLAGVAERAHSCWRERFTVERFRDEVLQAMEVPLSQWSSANCGT